MQRGSAMALLAIGVLMVIMPFAFGMFGRAPDGGAMIDDFRPIMQPASVEKTLDYYKMFQGLGAAFGPIMTEQNVAKFEQYMKGFEAMGKELPAMFAALGKQLNMSPKELQAFIGKGFPAVGQGLGGLPGVLKDFKPVVATMSNVVGPFQGVEPALIHYGDLTRRMDRNVANYAAADKLPPFKLFPWFFLLPGILISVLSFGLLRGSQRS